MSAKFRIQILMGYDFTGGRISHFLIDFCMALTTVQRKGAACERGRRRKLINVLMSLWCKKPEKNIKSSVTVIVCPQVTDRIILWLVWQITTPLLTHLFYGTTRCVVSILALYLTELQSVSIVPTLTHVDFASASSLSSFRQSMNRWIFVKLKSLHLVIASLFFGLPRDACWRDLGFATTCNSYVPNWNHLSNCWTTFFSTFLRSIKWPRIKKLPHFLFRIILYVDPKRCESSAQQWRTAVTKLVIFSYYDI